MLSRTQRILKPAQIFYLFSNNHINEIVSMRFDFDDDEVLVSGGPRHWTG